MPASRLSFYVTDTYRDALQGQHRTIEAVTRSAWSRIDLADLDASYPHPLLVAATSAAQQQAVQSSAAYLTAYLTSELDSPQEGPNIDPRPYLGRSRDGRFLREALASPLIAIKVRLKQGEPNHRAARFGLNRALRMVSLEIDHAAQHSLLAAIDTDERFDGWQRALRGTCGACMAAATGPDGGLRFPRHPHCKCVSEPTVKGVTNRFPRPTGAAIFRDMSSEDQDAALGPEAAEAVRSGVPLERLLATSPQATTEDFITQGETPKHPPTTPKETTHA